MKKINLVLFILVTGCYAVTHGSPLHANRKINVEQTGDVFHVTYKNPTQSAVKLAILDANGQEVFSEKVISKSGFTRPYNFSELPKGDYHIRITDNAEVYDELLCHRDQKWVARVAKVKGQENKYIVAIPHQNHHEIAVQVYNQNEELVFSENQTVDTDFAKIYKVRDLESPIIKVVNLSTGEERLLKTE